MTPEELERQLDRNVDLDRWLGAVVEVAARRVDADRATLYLIDRARSLVVSRVAQGLETLEIRLAFGEGVAGWVAETGRLVNVPNGVQDARFAPRIDAATGYTTRSLLAVPVRAADGRVVGVLQALNKVVPGGFSAPDEVALQALADRVSRWLERTHLAAPLAVGLPLQFRFNRMLGDSPPMRDAYARASRAARTDATVLILGESGSGKELLARAIHDNSARCDQPFVKVDCAALPEPLIENELFGHVRGGYTGADRDTTGKVQAANRGTLFLDEIGELPLGVQGRLLRLLQDRAFFRVGSDRVETADVRFVTATHRDLAAAVAAGRFRADLYWRLRVVEIALPPLRDRGSDDIIGLAEHFLYAARNRHRRPTLRFAPDAVAALCAHRWPGNVRELEHGVESAVVLAPGDVIRAEDLPLGAPRGDDGPRFSAGLQTLDAVERAYVAWALARHDGNRSATAKALGIGRNTLLRKLGESDES